MYFKSLPNGFIYFTKEQIKKLGVMHPIYLKIATKIIICIKFKIFIS